MFNVLICLGIGILTGILLHKLKWISSIVEKFTTLVIYLLLFTLGLKAGLDKTIMSRLHTLGFTALLISIFTILGSVGMAWLTFKLFFQDKSDES
jgi:Membrane protein of unknown function (DUF340).